jgi:hypothetical protein
MTPSPGVYWAKTGAPGWHFDPSTRVPQVGSVQAGSWHFSELSSERVYAIGVSYQVSLMVTERADRDDITWLL